MDKKEIIFDTHGNLKQKQVCVHWADHESIEIAYGGAKYSGKSYLGSSLIFADALTYPETHYFIARKSLNDLRKFTLPSIYEALTAFGIGSQYYKFNGQDNYFTLYNGSKVFLLEAKYMPSDPLFQRFGSMQMTRGWIEEGGEFDSGAKNNLVASVGRWKNDLYGIVAKVLITCNPSKNFLYKDFYKPGRENTLPVWRKFVQAYPTDNTMAAPGYIEHLLHTLSDNEKERLIYGNWEYDDDPAVLCEYDAIVDMFTNTHVLPGENRISADLAMQGRDKFVAGHWCGLIAHLDIVQDKSKGRTIESDLKGLMQAHKVPRSKTVVDSDGLGEYLESYLTGIKEFHGGAAATSKEFANLKTECAYKLAEVINKREIHVICDEKYKDLIIQECEQLKSDTVDNDTTKKKIIKKETIKEKIGRSPDFLDWLIMGMFFELPSVKSKVKGWAFN